MELERARFACPWCMTRNTVELEPEDRGQQIVQDCRICCRPVVLVCRETADGGIELDVSREED